jgi:hypothetical protein
MSNESCAPPAATARASRVQVAALSATVPIALAVGAVFAVPTAAVILHGQLARSTGVYLADDCHSRTARAPLASDVAFGAGGATKWPLCGGD